LDKLKVFLRKYKNILALSLCFIFALSAGFLTEKEKLKKEQSETETDEAKAFITKGKNESVDKNAEAKKDPVKESLPEKEIIIPEAFPDSDYEKEPLVTKEDLEKEASLPVAVSDPFSLSMPLKGEKITPYSIHPVYSETMDDWRSHEAIDIAASLGSEVASAEKGTVTFVGKDRLLGVVIKISHGENYETLYANLHSETYVHEGQEVTKGQVIGHVGESSVIESVIEPHLHFELYKNGKKVNPEEYIR